MSIIDPCLNAFQILGLFKLESLFFLAGASAAEFDSWNGLRTTDYGHTLKLKFERTRIGRSQAFPLGLALSH